MVNWLPARPTSHGHELPELCVNLWWYFDVEAELVQRLAGRAYALSGADDEKLRLLHALAPTDFHAATPFSVPERFKVVSQFGEIEGATGPEIVIQHHADVFREVYETLEADLPDQVRFVDGDPVVYRLEMPEDILHVITCVYEYADGRLVPQISKRP